MKTMEKKIVKEAVPVLLQEMMPNLSENDITKLAAVIISNICKYGYQSKKIIADAKLSAFKEFLPIAEKFLDNLHATVQIAEEHNEKRYDKIIDFVIDNSDLTAKEKVRLYINVEKEKDKLKKEWLEKIMPLACLLSVTIILVIIVVDPKAAKKLINAIVKMVKIITDGFVKIINAIGDAWDKIIGAIVKIIEAIKG